MKISHVIIFLLPTALLTACSSDTLAPDAGRDPITLTVGLSSDVLTRASAEDNHTQHNVIPTGAQLALQVSGTWTGKTSSSVVSTTTATVGDETTTDSKHNTITMSPQLYWDDYGTADPTNTAGRTAGLTIYGAGVPTYKEAVTNILSLSDWKSLSWTLPTDQSAGWGNYDLIISNNVQSSGSDGTYKFDERDNGKLLEFRHAMSKITVNLKAGKGFDNGTFTTTDVRLTSNEGTAATNSEWACTSGTVDITTGNVSSLTVNQAVTMVQETTPTADYTVTKTALVMPGCKLGESDNSIIARVNADDNIYYVTAAQIRAAMHKANASTDYTTQSGKNYIINVTVNKTAIVVTSTVVDWTDITAEKVEPRINIQSEAVLGGKTESELTNASLYVSTNKLKGYVTTPAYWPNHSTHFFFRGVWPAEVKIDQTGDTACVALTNSAANATDVMNKLLIGKPEIDAGTMCGSTDHEQVDMSVYGICAREQTVNLNFRHAMAEVEVNLSSISGNGAVDLSQATVQFTNTYSTGKVYLCDRSVAVTGKTSLYTLPVVEQSKNYMGMVVPQDISTIRFKITLTNSDGTTDVYYADVSGIKQQGATSLVTPNNRWESGNHYVYNLTLSKTALKLQGTLTDWTTVQGSDNVWF